MRKDEKAQTYSVKLFEIETKNRNDAAEGRWIVEWTGRRGQTLRNVVTGKQEAADYAAHVGGIIVGPVEEKEGGTTK